MNWTEAEIYTSTEGADIICASLLDIGIKGFSIKDSEDFNEFLKNKDGKWDYIDDDLMSLSARQYTRRRNAYFTEKYTQTIKKPRYSK